MLILMIVNFVLNKLFSFTLSLHPLTAPAPDLFDLRTYLPDIE